MVGLNSRKYILAVLFIAGLLIPSEVRAQLQVQPERNAIGINEDLRVEIVLEDGDSDSLDLTPLERDFEIVARARGSQVNIINGSMSKINTWSLRLVPKHSGTLTLPELCAASSCSAPVTIEVSDAPTSADDAKVILEHGSLPGRVYVGQQILYPVRLLFRTPLQQAVLDTPKPAGVDAEVIKLGEDQHRETYRGGWRYNVIERMYAIIPAQSGTLRIPPVSMEAQIEDPRTTRRRGMQGSLFDPFGSRGQRIRQRTAAAQIEVEPPARTEHPWFPAQELDIQDSWEENPPRLRVGEPATRSISISAQGTSAEHLPDLNLEVPTAFKIYPDQPERENLPNGKDGISAHLRQSAAIVPRTAGTFTLPGITLHWWDLRAQRWSTAHIEPMEVEVLPVDRTPQETPPATMPPSDEGAGINNPQKSPPSAPARIPPDADDEMARLNPTLPAQTSPLFSTHESLWVGIAALCALGWLITLVLWWRARTHVKALSRRGLGTNSAATEAKNTRDIEQALIKAAQRNDAGGARHMLHQWAARQYPESQTPLDTLCHDSGSQLQKALQQLNNALYSASSESWEGEDLADAIRNWSGPGERENGRKTEVKGKDLPPLYPRA